VFNTLTGFTYRGLSPHKLTPMPGVHQPLHPTRGERKIPSRVGEMADHAPGGTAAGG